MCKSLVKIIKKTKKNINQYKYLETREASNWGAAQKAVSCAPVNDHETT